MPCGWAATISSQAVQPVFLNTIVKSKIERYRALRRTMYHDSLTGLLNHSSGKNTLDMVLSGVSHEGSFLSVVMMDIDHFKQVNDTYGHPSATRSSAACRGCSSSACASTTDLPLWRRGFLITLPHTNASRLSPSSTASARISGRSATRLATVIFSLLPAAASPLSGPPRWRHLDQGSRRGALPASGGGRNRIQISAA